MEREGQFLCRVSQGKVQQIPLAHTCRAHLVCVIIVIWHQVRHSFILCVNMHLVRHRSSVIWSLNALLRRAAHSFARQFGVPQRIQMALAEANW